MLGKFMGKARVYLLICKVALDRFVRRGLDNTLREYFHGDNGVDMACLHSTLTLQGDTVHLLKTWEKILGQMELPSLGHSA
jgi:hypothetical protein